LFDAGRLIGGKPVPHVGWVFIERLPVRPSIAKSAKKASREASRPMPVPKAPPPNAKVAPKTKPVVAALKPAAPATKSQTAPKPVKPVVTSNDLTPFLEFVEKHPVGSKVKGTVDSYSAHGVYVRVNDVMCYLPLRLMANPAPRSAREHVKLGQSVSLVVSSFVASRRSIDVAISGVSAPEKKVSSSAAGKAKKKKKRQSALPARKVAAKKK
jgi:hypothetical protein